MAREFVQLTIGAEKMEEAAKAKSCKNILLNLEPNLSISFGLNIIFHVLAADGSPEKKALGDHSPKGYQQRKRFYSISDEAVCFIQNRWLSIFSF